MKKVGFYLVLPFLYLIAILPFPVLYLLSDLVYFILYKIAGYRRNVVRLNLSRSFPHKDKKELLLIERQFYRHLCDLFLETISLSAMSRNEVMRRCRVEETNIETNIINSGRSVIYVMGHQGNWEWAGASFPNYVNFPVMVIYKPLSNRYFDKYIFGIRKRFGAIPVAMKDVFRNMMNAETASAMVFIADQTPRPDQAIWTEFLNQDTPVFSGTAKMAKRFNRPILFASVLKEKRGYYRISTEILIENPQLLSEEEITKIHTQRLEEEIQKQPHTWLWSHRRWKHSRN